MAARLWREQLLQLLRLPVTAPSVGVPETFGGYRSSGVLRLTIFSSVQFPVCRKPQRSAQPTTNFSVGSVPHRGAVSASLGRLELGSRVPIEYQKPNGHNICMTRSGVTSTRELYCTRTVHALTVRCTVWLVLDRQTSDLLLPGQRGRCEQRPEVRRRRPLLRAQVEAQVCGAERHGLSGVITR